MLAQRSADFPNIMRLTRQSSEQGRGNRDYSEWGDPGACYNHQPCHLEIHRGNLSEHPSKYVSHEGDAVELIRSDVRIGTKKP